MMKFNSRKVVALLMCLSWLPLVVAGCANGANSGASGGALAQNALKVQKGMNETQVRALLGEPTRIINDSVSPSSGANISLNAWTYDGPPQINVGFLNGAVNAVTVDGKQTVGP